MRRDAIVAALAVVLLGACGAPPASRGPEGAGQPAAVRTVRAASASEDWIEEPGTVEATHAASVASRLAAVVDRVAVEEGDAVRRGDLLVRLDGRDIAAQIAAASAQAAAARARRERIRTLFGKDAATKQELEQAESEEASADAGLAAARAQLDYIDLRAPMDGLVVDKRVEAGDLASPGQKLLTIQGSGALRVTATLSESSARRLSVGQEVQAVMEDGSAVPANVAILSPAADPVSRRLLVKCDLPAGAPARAGSFVRLRFPAESHATPLARVPRRALVERGALTGLFVVEEGRARLRWVSVGQTAGDTAVVRSGLTPGEVIILDPAPGLADGAPVTAAAAENLP